MKFSDGVMLKPLRGNAHRPLRGFASLREPILLASCPRVIRISTAIVLFGKQPRIASLDATGSDERGFVDA
jgi:hypothetical protein